MTATADTRATPAAPIVEQHTPGPWWVARGREVRAHKQLGSPVVLDTAGICEVYSGGAGIEGADANARLIAAAPDMLDALTAAHAFIQIERAGFADCNVRPDGTFDEDDAAVVGDFDALLAQIGAAIVKAKGEAC